MIPWRPTSHSRIEVRHVYGIIPVAPGQHIVGWEVRVWHQGYQGQFGACDVCKRLVPGRRHKCSTYVPWRRGRWPSEGWQQPHHRLSQEPVLYPNAQLAYAAGLELLRIDVPERMHWNPAA
jgi:hypothetical protein